MLLCSFLMLMWFFESDTYKLYPSRLHYDIRRFLLRSTCVDHQGEPVRPNGSGTSKLYVDAAGRLGNSIFNFAGGYALSKSNHRTLMLTPKLAYYIQEVFDTPEHGQYGICEVPSTIDSLKLRYAVYQPEVVRLSHRKDIHFHNYLQSYKYFQPYEAEVRRLLSFHDVLISRAQQFLHDERQDQINESPVYLGIHVRRGDMIEQRLSDKGYNIAPMSYLHSAVQYFNNKFQNIHFVVCSDDIAWCKQQHVFLPENKSYSVSFSSGFSEGFDLALLSQCNHTIMTVGTFGWWAGWLAGGQVLYYKEPTRPGSEVNKDFKPEDFFPPQWIGLMGGEQFGGMHADDKN